MKLTQPQLRHLIKEIVEDYDLRDEWTDEVMDIIMDKIYEANSAYTRGLHPALQQQVDKVRTTIHEIFDSVIEPADDDEFEDEFDNQ